MNKMPEVGDVVKRMVSHGWRGMGLGYVGIVTAVDADNVRFSVDGNNGCVKNKWELVRKGRLRPKSTFKDSPYA